MNLSSPRIKVSVSPPSGGGEVTLEIVQVTMGEQDGSMWLACDKALQWGGDIDVGCCV